MAKPIKNVTIVGGGTAGWMAALMLQNGLPGGRYARITLIESPNIPTVGVGEATVPGMPRTLQQAGISETAFFKHCNASFKLGVDFANWNVDKNGKPISYINPFNLPPTFGRMQMASAFVELGAGDLDFVQCYAPTVDMMRACKAPRMSGAGEFDQTLGMAFAYHLDAGKFAGMLRDACVKSGVKHILDDVQDVEVDEKGFVAALQLERTGRYPVELVIDCTGFRGLIINKALQEPFIDYSRYLPNDRAMAVQIPHADPQRLEPVTRSTALGAGWSWRVPLYNRVGTGYVYSSAHRTDDEARDEFMAHLGPIAEGLEPRVIPMRIGRSRNAWVKNCVALGLSGGFIEPLESTAIHMIEMGIRWLISYFPDDDFAPPLRNHFNKLNNSLFNEVRDFICLHYALGNRTDAQYWIDARTEMEVPDTIAELMETWRHAIPMHYDLPFSSLFGYGTYQTVLLGKRVYETGYGRGSLARGARLDRREWMAFLKKSRQATMKRVNAACDHRRYLAEVRGEIESQTRVQPQAAGSFASFGGTAFPQATVAMPGTPMAHLPKAPPPAPKRVDEESVGLF